MYGYPSGTKPVNRNERDAGVGVGLQTCRVHEFHKAKFGKTEITSVSVLSSPEKFEWEVAEEGLVVKTPFKAPDKTAIVFKIETKGWRTIKTDILPKAMEPVSVDG